MMMSVTLLKSQLQKELYTNHFTDIYRNSLQKHVKKHLLRANHIVTTVLVALLLILHSDMKTEYLQLKITLTHYSQYQSQYNTTQ